MGPLRHRARVRRADRPRAEARHPHGPHAVQRPRADRHRRHRPRAVLPLHRPQGAQHHKEGQPGRHAHPLVLLRHARDQPAGRPDELPDARARPADARVRLREGRFDPGQALRQAVRLRDARRRAAPRRRKHADDLLEGRSGRDRRHHGRPQLRDRGRHRQPAARVRELRRGQRAQVLDAPRPAHRRLDALREDARPRADDDGHRALHAAAHRDRPGRRDHLRDDRRLRAALRQNRPELRQEVRRPLHGHRHLERADPEHAERARLQREPFRRDLHRARAVLARDEGRHDQGRHHRGDHAHLRLRQLQDHLDEERARAGAAHREQQRRPLCEGPARPALRPARGALVHLVRREEIQGAEHRDRGQRARHQRDDARPRRAAPLDGADDDQLRQREQIVRERIRHFRDRPRRRRAPRGRPVQRAQAPGRRPVQPHALRKGRLPRPARPDGLDRDRAQAPPDRVPHRRGEAQLAAPAQHGGDLARQRVPRLHHRHPPGRAVEDRQEGRRRCGRARHGRVLRAARIRHPLRRALEVPGHRHRPLPRRLRHADLQRARGGLGGRHAASEEGRADRLVHRRREEHHAPLHVLLDGEDAFENRGAGLGRHDRRAARRDGRHAQIKRICK